MHGHKARALVPMPLQRQAQFKMIAVMAPYVNSYRRYVKDHAAPINLEWARDNRTTGLRVPLSSPAARRVENRLAGMDCNPYLCIAASLACGYLGMKNKINPSAPYEGNAYEEALTLPRTLEEALRGLNENPDIEKLFGERFIQLYTSIKLMEFEEFNQVISSWEREYLLLNV